MTDLVLDPARSTTRIHTFAEGLLARLAHDLELAVSGELSGTATREDGSGKASIAIPLEGITVAGILGKGGIVDAHGLSASERQDIVAKMQKEVFHAGPDAVIRVETQLDGTHARIKIVPPSGTPFETTTPVDLTSDGDSVRAKGRFEVSLAALGSDAVKGPMGAFRVKDRVTVIFDVAFTRPARSSQPTQPA